MKEKIEINQEEANLKMAIHALNYLADYFNNDGKLTLSEVRDLLKEEHEQITT